MQLDPKCVEEHRLAPTGAACVWRRRVEQYGCCASVQAAALLCCSAIILTVLAPRACESHFKATPCACDSSSFHLLLSSCPFRSLTHEGRYIGRSLGQVLLVVSCCHCRSLLRQSHRNEDIFSVLQLTFCLTIHWQSALF